MFGMCICFWCFASVIIAGMKTSFHDDGELLAVFLAPIWWPIKILFRSLLVIVLTLGALIQLLSVIGRVFITPFGEGYLKKLDVIDFLETIEVILSTIKGFYK